MSATVTEGAGLAAAERWVDAFAEGWRAPSSLDAFADHFQRWFTDDIRMIQPQLPTTVGKQAFKEGFRPAFELIPDLHATVTDWAAHGDTVFIEFVLEGRIGRRSVRIPAVDRFTFRDGLVAERVAHFDPTPMVLAAAVSPRSWPRFLRIQAGQFKAKLRGGPQS